MTSLAPDYPREEHDWIVFPTKDTVDRKKYVPDELWESVANHPAKQNLYASMAIVDYVNNPWMETFLDPFGGIGTTMISTVPRNNNCILIEIEEEYVKTATQIRDYNDWGLAVDIIQSDNRLVLPMRADHIITSPPYGSDLSKGMTEGTDRKSTLKLSTGGNKEEADRNAEKFKQYAQHPQNIGRLNNFFYIQEMKRLYKKMVDCLPVGGTISITHRDRTKDNARVLYSMEIIQAVTNCGMKLEVFEKWLVPKTMQSNVNQAQGYEVVLDEDILIFRKPK